MYFLEGYGAMLHMPNSLRMYENLSSVNGLVKNLLIILLKIFFELFSMHNRTIGGSKIANTQEEDTMQL